MNAAAPPSPYMVIGEPAVARLVREFYDLVDMDPRFARLRKLHGADLAPIRHGLERYLVGWLGGPRDWFDRGQCLMSIHRVFPIDAELADQWCSAMTEAIAKIPEFPEQWRDRILDALCHMARAMINPSSA